MHTESRIHPALFRNAAIYRGAGPQSVTMFLNHPPTRIRMPADKMDLIIKIIRPAFCATDCWRDLLFCPLAGGGFRGRLSGESNKGPVQSSGASPLLMAVLASAH